jgi:hypothetical protein
MTKTIGVQLIVYSLLLAGLSYFVHHLAPSLAQPTLIAGLAGGALCLAWGVKALMGKTGKALPLLTLIPVTFVMLSQTILTWGSGSEGVSGRRLAAAVVTLLFVLSLAMLMRIAYAGVVFDGQPAKPAKDGAVQPQTAGKPAPAHGARRA